MDSLPGGGDTAGLFFAVFAVVGLPATSTIIKGGL
jgi:hypothetical protein